MNLTLHKLPEGFIVTSDEHWKTDDSIYDFKDNVFRICKLSHLPNGEEVKDRWCKKVIAQQDQIDFSALTEEKQKEIGWFDVEKIQKEKFLEFRAMITETSEKNLFEIGIREGFQKAQELLSDRRVTLEVIRNVFAKTLEIAPTAETHTRMISDIEYRHYVMNTLFNKHFQEFIKPKSWEIEVEMEYRDMMGMWVSRPTILEHLDRPSRPKLTNGKIKILKIK
jgi:hypothetical protein